VKIREATEQDKVLWDSFVDFLKGSFRYYFDWGYVFIPLGNQMRQIMVEDNEHDLIAIFPLVEIKRPCYTALFMGGHLFRRDIPGEEIFQVTKEVVKYIEKSYTKRCSTFNIVEEFRVVDGEDEYHRALLSCGFRLRRGISDDLPCAHELPLKKPFEETIWRGLWSQTFRRSINHAARTGIGVIKDREFKYLEDYVNMLAANYKRHKSDLPTREKFIREFNIFRDKTKLFVALENQNPVVILCCHYTPSTCYLWEIGSYTKDTDKVNRLCYKAAIEDACDEGYKAVHFGGSDTKGLAYFKDRFKGKRYPMKYYEKRYSAVRTFMELTPVLTKSLLRDSARLWRERALIWDRIVHW
jgi:hypothetical protein